MSPRQIQCENCRGYKVHIDRTQVLGYWKNRRVALIISALCTLLLVTLIGAPLALFIKWLAKRFWFVETTRNHWCLCLICGYAWVHQSR